MARIETIKTATTVAAGCIALAALFLPNSFVVESPGPAVDTLGTTQGQDGKQVRIMQVEGRESFPSESRLDLTTVSVGGGPGREWSGSEILRAWMDPTNDVAVGELYYPVGTSVKDSDAQNAQAMVSSQDLAVSAALTELDIPYKTTVTVAELADDTNAGILHPGDVIESVDGQPATSVQRAIELVRKSSGQELPMSIKRDGESKALRAKIKLVPAQGGGTQRAIGAFISEQHDFPFTVKFGLKDIGGPSAGTMMALGLIDELTPGSLAGDHHVAGTGTITSEGTVGPIGGIAQKVVGARQAGASVFLAPQANCAELSGRVPSGLTVYSVSTLHEARGLLEGLEAGEDLGSAKRCG